MLIWYTSSSSSTVSHAGETPPAGPPPVRPVESSWLEATTEFSSSLSATALPPLASSLSSYATQGGAVLCTSR